MRRYEGIWQKRQMISTWTFQIICAVLLGAAAIVLLAAAAYVSHEDDFDNTTYNGYSVDTLMNYAAIEGGVILALAIITVILASTEIVFYHRQTLSPVFLLISACFKTAVWLTYLVLVIISAVEGSISFLSLFASIGLAGTSITQLVLGARFTHAKRKGLLPPSGGFGPAAAQYGPGAVETGYVGAGNAYGGAGGMYAPAPTYDRGYTEADSHEMQPPKTEVYR